MTSSVMPSAALLGVVASAESTPVDALRIGEAPPTGDASAFSQVLAAIQGEATEIATPPATAAELVEIVIVLVIDVPTIDPEIDIASTEQGTTPAASAPQTAVSMALTDANVGSSRIDAMTAGETTNPLPAIAVAEAPVLDDTAKISALPRLDAHSIDEPVTPENHDTPPTIVATPFTGIAVDASPEVTEAIVVDDTAWTPTLETSTRSRDTDAACEADAPTAHVPAPRKNETQMPTPIVLGTAAPPSPSRPTGPTPRFEMTATTVPDAPSSEELATDDDDGGDGANAMALETTSEPKPAIVVAPPPPAPQQPQALATAAPQRPQTIATNDIEPKTTITTRPASARAPTPTPIAVSSVTPPIAAAPQAATPSIAAPSIPAAAIATPPLPATPIAAPAGATPASATPASDTPASDTPAREPLPPPTTDEPERSASPLPAPPVAASPVAASPIATSPVATAPVATAPLSTSPTTDASLIAEVPTPPFDAPTSASPLPPETSTRAPIDAQPKPPLVLSRAEDLALAIEQLRPIPRGGATIEVEAPGLGAIRLHVAIDGDTVKIRIHAGSNAIAWFAREHDGLCSAARQAVPESQSVDLQLQTGGDSRGNQSQPHARTYAANDENPQPQRARTQTPRDEAPTTPASSRSLVDVLA